MKRGLFGTSCMFVRNSFCLRPNFTPPSIFPLRPHVSLNSSRAESSFFSTSRRAPAPISLLLKPERMSLSSPFITRYLSTSLLPRTICSSKSNEIALFQPTRQLSSSPDRKERQQSSKEKETNRKNFETAIKSAAAALLFLALTYISVPLYRVFCSTTGFGGTPIETRKEKRIQDLTENYKQSEGRKIRVTFTTHVNDKLPWKFHPLQHSVICTPGKSTLAFFNATNRSDKNIIGVATYNVNPPRAAKYFIKVQCFCFDEQRLLPKESVDMPVLFYLDPELVKDRWMDKVKEIDLSYTFFKVCEYDEEEEEEEEEEGEEGEEGKSEEKRGEPVEVRIQMKLEEVEEEGEK